MFFRLRTSLNPRGIAAKLGTSKENSKEKGRIFQDFLSKGQMGRRRSPALLKSSPGLGELARIA